VKNIKPKKAKKDPDSRNAVLKENPSVLKKQRPLRRKQEQDRDAKTGVPGSALSIQREKIFRISICLFLCVSVAAVYWQVGNHGFLNFDDPLYITENPHVNSGVSFENIRWAFTSFHASNWHPLTWLSHMADCRLFGLEAGRHHLMNVFIHILNAILLFLVLHRMTKAMWQSAFVAALFALHPLHVESVAWAAERKDVLSTLFWMLTMGAYAFYVENPAPKRYLPLLLFFALGLTAKPMLVTLPFVLLLLDYWPLARFRIGKTAPRSLTAGLAPLIREKIPLFVLSAAASIITFVAQKHGGAVETIESLSIPDRLANAAHAYVQYILKMFWPQDLAAFYPFPGSIPPWEVAGSFALLALMTVAFIYTARRLPVLTVGWLWYLGTLVPVIGLVQVGSQAMADRYTYIPLIGIFVMAAWGVPELTKMARLKAAGSGVAAVIVILSLAVVSWKQVSYWRDNLTLFGHAIEITDRNHLAHNNLGLAFLERGELDTAAMHFRKAAAYNPTQAEAYNNLGMVFMKQGRTDEATSYFRQALSINPNSAEAYSNMGDALASQGKIEEAMRCFRESLRLKPDNASAFVNLGYAAASQGNWSDAIFYFEQTIRIRPNSAEVHYNLGNSLVAAKRTEEAVAHFREAVRIKPDYAKAYNNLGSTLLLLGRVDEAVAGFRRALEIQPGYETARENLQDALALQKSPKLPHS